MRCYEEEEETALELEEKGLTTVKALIYAPPYRHQTHPAPSLSPLSVTSACPPVPRPSQLFRLRAAAYPLSLLTYSLLVLVHW